MFRELKELKASPSWFMNQDLNPEPSASKESITNFPLSILTSWQTATCREVRKGHHKDTEAI